MNRTAQFSVIEMVLVFSLFAFSLSFLYEAKEPINTNYEYSIESFMNSMYYNETIVHASINENLSLTTISQNWTKVKIILDEGFGSYGFIVSNNTVSKRIFNCNTSYNRYITERLITISNQTSFDFRIITLEVCY